MNGLQVLRWELGRLTGISLGLAALSLLLGGLVHSHEPQVASLIVGAVALCGALIIGAQAGGADADPSIEFFLSRNVSRFAVFWASCVAALLAEAVVLAPLLLFDAHPATSAFWAAGLAGLCLIGGLGRLTQRTMVITPLSAALVTAPALVSDAFLPGTPGFIYSSAALLSVGLGLWWLACRRVGASGKGAPAYLLVGLAFAALWGIVESVAITPREAAVGFLKDMPVGRYFLPNFDRRQALYGLRSVQPANENERLRWMEGLVRLGAPEATRLFLERWRQRTDETVHGVDALAMRWWVRPADVDPSTRERLFEWARRVRGDLVRGGLREAQAFIYLTGRLDPERAAEIWLPALLEAAQRRPEVVLGLFGLNPYGPSLAEIFNGFLPVEWARIAAERIDLSPKRGGRRVRRPAGSGSRLICVHAKTPQCIQAITSEMALWTWTSPAVLRAMEAEVWLDAIRRQLARRTDDATVAGALVWAAWHGELPLIREYADRAEAVGLATADLQNTGWRPSGSDGEATMRALGLNVAQFEAVPSALDDEGEWTGETVEQAEAGNRRAHDVLVNRLHGHAGQVEFSRRDAPSAILRTARALEIVTGEWHGADATAWRAALARRFGD